MKTRMPAVECNYHENKLAADRLYNNDEWISTGHAAGLRGKHREECTGETAQRRHGKDGYSKLYAAYSRLGRIEYSPKFLLKIMVYGYMRKQISSREGQCAPDHNTINRFRKNILTQEAGQDILRQLVIMLHERGLLSLEAAFIDGTKIEANANKYSFVWKKATAKKTDKLLKRIHEELPAKLKEVGIRFYIPEKIAVRQLKKLRKRIYARMGLYWFQAKEKGKRRFSD